MYAHENIPLALSRWISYIYSDYLLTLFETCTKKLLHKKIGTFSIGINSNIFFPLTGVAAVRVPPKFILRPIFFPTDWCSSSGSFQLKLKTMYNSVFLVTPCWLLATRFSNLGLPGSWKAHIFFFFYIMRVAHCASKFMCNIFLKRTLSQSGLLMLLVLRLVHNYVRNEMTNEIWILSTFWTPLSSFFEEARSFAAIVFTGPFFFPKNHDAHIIFLFPLIIFLAVLALCFLLFAHSCSLFAVRWLILTDRFLLLTV